MTYQTKATVHKPAYVSYETSYFTEKKRQKEKERRNHDTRESSVTSPLACSADDRQRAFRFLVLRVKRGSCKAKI